MIQLGFSLAFLLALLYGWIVNIINIIQTMPGELGGIFVLRVIGIFVFPMGSIIGYY